MTEFRFREAAKGVLESLAQLDERLGPEELICLWFDDVYTPGQKLPEGYPRDVWEKGLEQWNDCFTSDELKAMAAFHSDFDSVADDLPCDSAAWKADPRWLQIGRAAESVLKVFAK